MLNEKADELRSSWSDDFFVSLLSPPDLWKEMLDLIYSGNMNQAWQLVDLSWPKSDKRKSKFLKEFKTQLSKSRYWQDIQKLNEAK